VTLDAAPSAGRRRRRMRMTLNTGGGATETTNLRQTEK